MRNEPDLLSVAEVAELLDKSVRTVHRMIQDGRLVATKLPGHTGAYVIRREDVPEQVAA